MLRKPPTPPKLKKLKTVHKPKPTTKPRHNHPSSNITDHKYDPETGQLTVTFHSGSQYRYDGVSPEKAAGFGKAESRGKFLHTHILGKHDATKM